MSSEHENLDEDLGDDIADIQSDEVLATLEPESLSSKRAGLAARSRLEELREMRALRKAIYDDLYSDDDLGDY